VAILFSKRCHTANMWNDTTGFFLSALWNSLQQGNLSHIFGKTCSSLFFILCHFYLSVVTLAAIFLFTSYLVAITWVFDLHIIWKMVLTFNTNKSKITQTVQKFYNINWRDVQRNIFVMSCRPIFCVSFFRFFENDRITPNSFGFEIIEDEILKVSKQ